MSVEQRDNGPIRPLSIEYWVDVFGGIVPGAFFIVAVMCCVIPSVSVLISLIEFDFSVSLGDRMTRALTQIEKISGVAWFVFGLIAFPFIFFIGHIFYRQDPKLPDQKSFERLQAELLISMNPNAEREFAPSRYEYFIHRLKSSIHPGVELLNREQMIMRGYNEAIYNKKGGNVPSKKYFDTRARQEYCCDDKESCEFPYLFLDSYLKKRELFHLLRFTTWAYDNNGERLEFGGKDRDRRGSRSKNFINILKVRLKFYFPSRCGTIIRNEAHIRLSSSMWYAAGSLITCTRVLLISLIFIAIIRIITFSIGISGGDECSYLNNNLSYLRMIENYAVLSRSNCNIDLENMVSDMSISAIILGAVFLGSHYIIEKVERFIHYQRQREIVHVLETAYVAFRDTPELLSPPFGQVLDVPTLVMRTHDSN